MSLAYCQPGVRMRRSVMIASIFVLTIFCGNAHGVGYVAFAAQNWSTSTCGDEGDHGLSASTHRTRVCELRTTTLPFGGSRLKISTENGGIQIIGEERTDIVVEARVRSWAGSASEAREILRQIAIEASGDSIHDSGPRFHWGNNGYSVSYKLHVPRHLSANLSSTNGGIAIAHLDSDIAFDTTNGGVELKDLAGNVSGKTVNGGLSIQLTGDQWLGKGLHAETMNGGVELSIPENYSAHLETGTVNGTLVFDFPVKINGDLSKKKLVLGLGSGGSTIHAETTNGSVHISHKNDAQKSL